MTDDGLSDLAARYISGQPIGSQSEGFRALPPRDEILDREDIGLRMGVNRQYIDILIEKGDFQAVLSAQAGRPSCVLAGRGSGRAHQALHGRQGVLPATR